MATTLRESTIMDCIEIDLACFDKSVMVIQFDSFFKGNVKQPLLADPQDTYQKPDVNILIIGINIHRTKTVDILNLIS